MNHRWRVVLVAAGILLLVGAVYNYAAEWNSNARAAERYQLFRAGRINQTSRTDMENWLSAKLDLDRAGAVSGTLGVLGLLGLAAALYRPLWRHPTIAPMIMDGASIGKGTG